MSEVVVKKRTPVKRWIILALLVLAAFCAYFGPTILRPIRPAVLLPAEPTGLEILGFKITNTIVATLLTDVILLLFGFGAYRFVKSGKLVPSGIYNAFEAIIEFLWNSVEGSAGKWARRIFPVPATIFLLVFVANMVRLVPGFEAFGRILESPKEGYAPVQLVKLGSFSIYSIDKGQPREAAASETTAHEEAPCTFACEIVPWLRGSSTDLNFTLALAIVAVVATQVFGVLAYGGGYFEKFIQIKQLVSGGIFGLINFAVGFLEIILEFAKVLSFGFRLFGNVFAGSLLLAIVGTLLAVGLPAGLYLFEIFFGLIQAYVFFLLATVFISGATVSHHAEESH